MGAGINVLAESPAVAEGGFFVVLESGSDAFFFGGLCFALCAGGKGAFARVVVKIIEEVGMVSGSCILVEGAEFWLVKLLAVVVDHTGKTLGGVHMGIVNSVPASEQFCHNVAEHQQNRAEDQRYPWRGVGAEDGTHKQTDNNKMEAEEVVTLVLNMAGVVQILLHAFLNEAEISIGVVLLQLGRHRVQRIGQLGCVGDFGVRHRINLLLMDYRNIVHHISKDFHKFLGFCGEKLE